MGLVLSLPSLVGVEIYKMLAQSILSANQIERVIGSARYKAIADDEVGIRAYTFRSEGCLGKGGRHGEKIYNSSWFGT